LVTSARTTWRVIQVALVVALVGFAGWHLWRQWTTAAAGDYQFDVRPVWLLFASLVVLGTYALLIETWRQVLRRLGARVPFGPAARVWFVSNLGKYVPGKIWQVTAMTVMIGKYGVPVAVSGASAIVMTIANVASGFAIILLTSTTAVRELAGDSDALLVAAVGLGVCLAAIPMLARQWNNLAVRLGREQLTVSVPMSTVWLAVAGCAVSWILYGIAFQMFVRALLGTTVGSTSAYIAAYALSYLIGYLAVFAPGGIGARELVLTTLLVPLGLANPPQAALITVGSRLWLTVLEIVPSLAALVAGRSPQADAESRGRRIP
jgi:uncharacterized membrane protein YbhN (UPF0104 family)